MNYNPLSSFRVQVIFRVILLVLLSITFSAVLYFTNWFFTPLVLGILILIVTLNLINYHEKTIREIGTFLTSLRQGNFTNRYIQRQKGKGFDELELLFEGINLAFQKLSADKESHYQYLKALNDNIGVAIISYLDDGSIELMNPSARELFNKPGLRTISDLERVSPDVYKKLMELKSGGADVVKTVLNNEVQYLSIICRTFIAQEITYHLVLIQNIRKALDDKESEAWQKLVRVLTHEIMNSVTPISSLSTAINQTLKDNSKIADLKAEDIEDIQLSLETIENRSNGLIQFVKAYKDYARDIELNLSEISIESLLRRVSNLIKSLKTGVNVNLIVEVSPSNLTCLADEGLLEQVLINLVQNAVEAIDAKENGIIKLKGYKDLNNIIIEIDDNGCGIDKENLENVFVPFFTTKRRGTGVGLSLSKKIMQLHKGDILLNTSPEGTTFRLLFKY